MSQNWRQALIRPTASIIEAIELLDKSALQIVMVVDEFDALLGVVTDGDVRRALLKRIDLDQPVKVIMNAQPTSANVDDDNATILAQLTLKKLRHMPIVQDKKLIGLKTLTDLLEEDQQKNAVVLMVGGLGSRLGELTHATPKPMLKVGGKPILQTIIERFVAQGFVNIYLAVNYKADIIRSFFGDGSQFGANIQYLLEEQKLGTAGALSLLPDQSEPVVVMNGDLLTKVNFKSIVDFHHSHSVQATMCVREYEFQVPFGVVSMENDVIIQVDEKPTRQFFVNAGIYVLSPSTLCDIPKKQAFDMTTLFSQLLEKNQPTTCYPIREYWMDIGQLHDFKKASVEFDDNFSVRESD